MTGHTHAHTDHGEPGHTHTHDEPGHTHPHNEPGHDHLHGDGLFSRIRHLVTPHSHDAVDKIISADDARAYGIRTAWISLAGMLGVAVAQIVIVVMSGSIGLYADTIHSLGHALTTIPLIVAFRLGARKPTARYSYGFHRAEDVAGVFIVFIVFLTVLHIGYGAVEALVFPLPLENIGWVIAAGVVGFLGNEAVAIFRIRAGRRIGSAALVAEGQHARADGLTSLAVVAGAILAACGMPQADAIVGLFIAVVVFGVMLSSLRSILGRLMDGVAPDVLGRMTEAVRAVPGVRDAVVRARWGGHRVFSEAFVAVDPARSVGDTVAIAGAVRAAVMRVVPNAEPATVEFNNLPDRLLAPPHDHAAHTHPHLH